MKNNPCRLSLVWIAVLAFSIVGLGLTALPQAIQAQSNDPNVTRFGYAIITPATPVSAGMVVFQAQGDARAPGSLQSGILPGRMTTSALLPVDSNAGLMSGMAVAVANPGNANVFVTLILRRNDGAVVGSKGMLLWAGTQRIRFLAEMFPAGAALLDFAPGTLLISCEEPVSVTGLQYEIGGFSLLPATSLTGPEPVPFREPGVGGPEAIVLPYFAVGSGSTTGLIIANAGSDLLTARVDFYTQNGLPMGVTLNGQTVSTLENLSIPSGGSLSIMPQNSMGAANRSVRLR